MPEFIDDDDVKTIDDAIDDITMIEEQKRQIIGGGLGIDRPKRKRKFIRVIFKAIISIAVRIIIEKLDDLAN